MNWAIPYIGTPWSEEHDCWFFFRRIQQEQFGRDVPEEGYDLGSAISCAHALNTGKQSRHWRRVEKPEEGDAVLMGKNKHPSHIGVWAEVDGGGILHCQRGSGVVFTDLRRAASCGWGHVEFYRYTV